MLTSENNQILTRVGPGTAMGGLFRHFWQPALLSEELSGPDCPPVRVRLMGEDFVAFRDSAGRVGLLDSHCPHRLADLYFGRGDFRRALGYYQRTLASQPDDFEATLQAGASARRAGDPQGASRYYLAAERLRPDSWLPLYDLACLWATTGRPEPAAKLLERSLQLGFHRPDLLAGDPDLEAVRRRPEYPELLRRAQGAAERPRPEPGAGEEGRGPLRRLRRQGAAG